MQSGVTKLLRICNFVDLAGKCLFTPILGHNSRRGGPTLTPNKLVVTFRVFYLPDNFRENQLRSETVRLRTNRRENGSIICPMLCYSYGTENDVHF